MEAAILLSIKTYLRGFYDFLMVIFVMREEFKEF